MLPVSHKTPHLLLHVAWNEFEYFMSENLLLHPYPNAFLKNVGDIIIGSLPPSVNQSVDLLCILLLKCVSYSHEWGAQIFAPPPHTHTPWGGVKRSNIIKFQ